MQYVATHMCSSLYIQGGPGGTGRGGVWMGGGREGPGARKGNGVRGHRLPSPPWVVQNLLKYLNFSVSMRKVAGKHPFCVLIYMNTYIFHICFIFIYFIVNI